jgi:hypothetical protein
MSKKIIELVILLSILFVSVFAVVNNFTDWVRDEYTISLMVITLWIHMMWSGRNGNKA